MKQGAFRIVVLVFVVGFLIATPSAQAVPAAVKAKSEFMQAEKKLNEQAFWSAALHAENAREALGKTNSRIEYVLVKAYVGAEDYGKALEALEAFFEVTPESQASSAEYSEMVALYAEVEAKATTQKRHENFVSIMLEELPSTMVQIPRGGFKRFGKYQIYISSFYMGKYEVTQGLWLAVMGDNPSKNKGGNLDHPVTDVSWDEVQLFLEKLNAKTGKNYRLPTEAEWDYACRGGKKNQDYCGSNSLDLVGWYESNSGGKTHPVGEKRSNGFGLYDMTGNVWEFCNDWFDGYYSDETIYDPQGASSGPGRVIRGGAYNDEMNELGNTNSYSMETDSTGINVGLRLARPLY